MSIERFYTTTFSVQRMSWSNESSGEITAGSFVGHIQQARPETAQFVADAIGRLFLAWCDEAEDVQPGDTVTIASGDYAGTYSVKMIQVNATGDNRHLEISLVKDI